MRPLHLIWPFVIGLGVIVVMFCREFDPSALAQIHFTGKTGVAVTWAVILMMLRDAGLAWRFKIMCGARRLSWGEAIKTNLLCEFTSAATPSAVGGSGLIALYLNAFGISAGKGVAVTVSTLFLDELFFILLCPLLFVCFSTTQLFGDASGMLYVFIPVYALIVAWTATLYVALFRRPDLVQAVLIRISKVRLLHRWRGNLEQTANDLSTSAEVMKSMPLRFWARAALATALAWTARYMVPSALFLPFVSARMLPLIFARGPILWIIMMVSPTPGGSGIIEMAFSTCYADTLGNASVILLITCVWRIITYYAYLLAGLSVLPNWMKKYRCKLSPN